MSNFLAVASWESRCKGYNYYMSQMVVHHKQMADGVYIGLVKGNGDNLYHVKIDVNHARKSSCNCEFANGRRVVCKHAVALYFAIFPDKAQEYLKELETAEKEYEEYQSELRVRLEQEINRMNKQELKNALRDLLSDCPEWLYDRFIRTYVEK